MLGPGLNRFVRCRRLCMFGQRATPPLCECVWHVLRQLDSCGRPAMRRVVPLYDAPIAICPYIRTQEALAATHDSRAGGAGWTIVGRCIACMYLLAGIGLA